jgi:hypothetical protein
MPQACKFLKVLFEIWVRFDEDAWPQPSRIKIILLFWHRALHCVGNTANHQPAFSV